MHKINQNVNFINCVLFSDEPSFCLMDMLIVITVDTGQTEIYIGCSRFIANNQQKVWSPYHQSFRFPMARYLQFLQQQVASRLKQIHTPKLRKSGYPS
jgi:hypothetical protein